MSRPPCTVVRFGMANLRCWTAFETGLHAKAIRRARPSDRRGRQPASRVERSESVDEREASARITGVMAGRFCERSRLGPIRRSDAMLSFLAASPEMFSRTRSDRLQRVCGPVVMITNRRWVPGRVPNECFVGAWSHGPDSDAAEAGPRVVTLSRR
jgi:hypothetical protein